MVILKGQWLLIVGSSNTWYTSTFSPSEDLFRELFQYLMLVTRDFDRYYQLILLYSKVLWPGRQRCHRSGRAWRRILPNRVVHRVLLRSERIVLLRSFKAHNILLRSFFKFLATYETQNNDAFFCVLFLRT